MEQHTTIPISVHFDDDHYQQLAADDIIEFVDAATLARNPTRGGGFMFPVEEQRYDEHHKLYDRMRMIFWPRAQNDYLAQTYTAKTHLYHISKYHHAIFEEAAITGDIKCGFYGIEIPEDARALFRIQDQHGRTWQMTRLPMGIRTAVELMEMVTLALIGHPDVCKPDMVLPNVIKHGFVDDFRVAGTVANVERTAEYINNRCARFSITLKGALTVQRAYTFLGLWWDHTQRSIAIGEKTLLKIPDNVDCQMQYGDFQRFISRLIYCAGALRSPLAPFYFSMKWACRRCNELNHNKRKPEDVLNIPESIRHQLDIWQSEIRDTKIFAETAFQARRHATLYTDASLFGWGAIMITADFRVFVAGGKWSRAFTSGDICHLEASAVRNAARAFAQIILEHGSVDFRIDNTSVAYAVMRGVARAPALNVALAGLLKWLSRYDIVVTASYVKSDDNLADPVSRGLSTPSLSREIVASVYERRGAGGFLGA